MKEPLSIYRKDEPFFAKQPEWFLYWLIHPTKNAKRAVQFYENLKKPAGPIKIKNRPFKIRLLHWFMTKILRWKYIPASAMQESPVFQAVLKDLDRKSK